MGRMRSHRDVKVWQRGVKFKENALRPAGEHPIQLSAYGTGRPIANC